MQPTDPILAAFLLSVAGIAILAVWSILRMALERRGSLAPPGRAGLRFRRGILVLAGLGLLCFAWGLWVEPNWPEVTHVTVPITGMPRGRTLRIVQLSDLHAEASHPGLAERLPGLVAEQHPDVIVFTGDTLNSADGLPIARKLLTALARIAPTYVVRGNWDVWYSPTQQLFAGTGVVELDRNAVPLVGGSVWLAGLDYGHDSMLDATLAKVPRGLPIVLLYHTPDIAEKAEARHVVLVLAGHTHGGQVALPGYGAMVTFSKFGKRFEAGLAYAGATAVYTNRGLGMEGGSMPRVRFWARPEVTVVDVVGR